MAGNLARSPAMDSSFNSDKGQKDLRALSAAIMAATEKAELVAHETDRWLNGHQEFNNLEIVHSLVSEAEGRLVQIRQMTVIQELDKFMDEITANAPIDQAKQLNSLMASTKESFSSAIDSLQRFVQRSENIDKAYSKYKESENTLGKVLSDTSNTLHQITLHSDLAEINDQVEAVKSSRGMLGRMKTCLRNMKDSMAGIESLTLTVCDLGMEHYVKEPFNVGDPPSWYKQRRAELSDALARLESVQSELEMFVTLHSQCESSIAELNGAIKDPVTDSTEMESIREHADQVQQQIHDMERVVESLENQDIKGVQRSQLSSIKEDYSKLVTKLSSAYSDSYQNSMTATPRGSAKSSPRRSPRHRNTSGTSTPRQSLRQWLRSKTDELQELMARPFPFNDKNIQVFWHSIQKYQGDLVVKGEEFSLYASEADGDQPTMDQITPLIDTCADLSYRLDAHARLCVQYTADQNGLLSEYKSLEEAKASLQHSDIPLRQQHRMCADLLDQVTSLKRRVHDQLTNKLPAITVNLAKKEAGTILTETSELDAAVSKLKLEIKAFYQSLEASISNLDLLTKQLTDLYRASSLLDQSPDNFTLNEPISRENVVDALSSCKTQLAALAERQQYIDKLLSEKGTAIGRLPNPDDEEFEQTLTESKNTADRTRRKLEQHHNNLTSLQETIERFDTRCGVANDRLNSAEDLLNQASGSNKQQEVLETIETVTTECKTRLHECVTCIEEAEIAVTEMEQTSDGAGKMDPHKDTIKEIQAKHKQLSSRLREVEKKVAAVADNQRSLDSLTHKFENWLKSAQETIGDEIGLDSGLNDMRDHIIQLHELEKSVEPANVWLTEMKKLCRSLNANLSAESQQENSQLLSDNERDFHLLQQTLTEKIDKLSKEMEAVIAWIQKSSDLVSRLNQTKYQLTELASKETDPDSIQWKLDTLKGYCDSTQGLHEEFKSLVETTPAAITDKQRKSSVNGQESCEMLLADLTSMHNGLSQVDKVWTEFTNASAEVKDHLRHCTNQMGAVDVPGVSLDARKERYEEIVEALEHYPDGVTPTYLQELLSTCPIASPGLYTEAVALVDEHERLLSVAKKGASEFSHQLQARADLEAQLKKVTSKFRETSDRLQDSLALEHWDVNTCDSAVKMIKAEETELRAISDKMAPLIAAQKEQHSATEETMTLDFKDTVDDYTEVQRELTAQMVQEKESLVLAKEYCQYMTEAIDLVRDWLSCTQIVSDGVSEGTTPTEAVEQQLQLALGEVVGVRSHIRRISDYSKQVHGSLTKAAQLSLAELVVSLSEDTDAREAKLNELLDEYGQLGQTKVKHGEQLKQMEEVVEQIDRQVSEVSNSKPASLAECQARLQQIQALESQQPDVQMEVENLYQTTDQLAKLLKLSAHEPNEHEQEVKKVCVDRWGLVKSKLMQAKKEAASSLRLHKDVDDRYKAIEGADYAKVKAEVQELESADLHSLSAQELDRLAQRAGRCNSLVGQLWQDSLATQQLESSLLSKSKSDSKPSGRASALISRLSSLADRCHVVEGEIEKTSSTNRQACDSLSSCLDQMRQVETTINQVDEVDDVHRQQEQLQQAKNQVCQLYQKSNEVISSLKSSPPPDVSNVMNSIHNLNESLLGEIQQKLGQTERVMEQWNVVHVMQQDMETWMSNVRQILSADVVDSRVAQDQQREIEENVVKYDDKLKVFTAKSQALEREGATPESQRLLGTVSNFQNSLSGIKQGLAQRRDQVSQLVKEEDNFQTDLQQVGEMLAKMNKLVRQEVSEVTMEKCEQLANQYQEEMRKMPQVDKKINDLVALSIRLADSSHHADSATKAIDLKKEWATVKTQLTQQAAAVKETTRTLLSAPQLSVTHGQWLADQNAIKSEAEDSLRDLHLKVDGSELMQTDQVLGQLKQYEVEGAKLKGLDDKIEELVARKKQLKEASLDPLMLKDWAGQMTKIDTELKQLYMKSEETAKRQANAVEKAHKLAAEGMKREQMEELIVPQLTQALDLSMESENYMEDTPKSAVTPHQPSLSLDEHASKLFTVEQNPQRTQAEKKMNEMISEHETLQSSLADVNRKINQWQWTLDQDYHTIGELNDTAKDIQQAKVQLEKLARSETGAQEPSLSVLAMSLETLELRCLSELQRLEVNDSLTQGHRETLDSIEEEVVACQKYLDYLSSMSSGAEDKLPGVEHRVSKLQRMFQTLRLINPALCEGSLVSEYLGQLMNDLQVLQGRLEVIPEEDDFHTHGRELHSWQEHMAEHVSQNETKVKRCSFFDKLDSDTEFVDRVVSDLNTALGTLVDQSQSHNSDKHVSDSLAAYRELLLAARQGLDSGRFLDYEHHDKHRDNLQGLFTLFETYRLHLGALTLTCKEKELGATIAELTSATEEVQGTLWCEGQMAKRVQEETTALCHECDALSKSMERLHNDYLTNKITLARLEKGLASVDAEYQGLHHIVGEHLATKVRCVQLKDKLKNLQQLRDSLQECADNSSETEADGMKELFSQLVTLQQSSQRKLELSAPLSMCLSQALELLVELDTFNWMFKDLYGDGDEVDLDFKASVLSIKPKMNIVRGDLKAKLRECSGNSDDEICKVYSWLGQVKPFNKQLASLSAVDDHLHSLLTYQCELSQRSYITGLMMSLVTSCEHDVIVASQNTVKVLHEMKMAGSKQLATVHSLRDSYKGLLTLKKRFQSWISVVQLLCKDCPIGSQSSVTWLLHKCKVLHEEGIRLSSERMELTKKGKQLSSERLCSQSALREMDKQVKDVLDKQETSLKSLNSLIEKLRLVEGEWREFIDIYRDACNSLDKKECVLETVPTLTPQETVQAYLSHLNQLKSMLRESNKQTDRIQPAAHRLRLNITVNSTLQEVDDMVKSVKSREYRIYSQRIPLMVERWLKAQVNMNKYEHSVSAITRTIQGCEAKLLAHKEGYQPTTAKVMEKRVNEYQRLLHDLDSIDWAEIDRHCAGVGQLTGVILCQAAHLRSTVDNLRTQLVKLVTESTESCASLSHSSQSMQTLETKLTRMERDPLVVNSHNSLSHRVLLERRSKLQQMLYTLLGDRQTIDNVEAIMHGSAQQHSDQADSISMVEGRYKHVLDLITTKLLKLQEDIIEQSDDNQLQAAYQDWKNQVIKLTSMQCIGEVGELEEQRQKCLYHINLSPAEKLSLSALSRSAFSMSDHEQLVDSLHHKESQLVSLIIKHKLFNRLKISVMYSLSQLDCHLNISRTYTSHNLLAAKVPRLKAVFEQHQRSSLVMRQICQELLPHSSGSARSTLLASVQKASTRWQSVLSKFISQSEESMAVLSNAKKFNQSLHSLAKELGSVRHGCCGSLPEHHDHLQERQSFADVYQWRLEKLSSKSSVLKFDLSALESQVDELVDVETCFHLSQTLMADSDRMVCDVKHELNDKLYVWSNFVSEVNAALRELQQLEKLYMNEKKLTIEELLEEITGKYSLELKRMQKKSEALISRGTLLLSTTGELYSSAIQHGVVSLQNSLKHLLRLSTTRTNKLRDTMSAILEFEHGMKSLNQWFQSTESALSFTPNDWQESTLLSSNQYLVQLEKDVSHHSRTVTAVINLCSLLQYDRDAGYDYVVKRELTAVKERLNTRWKALCEKIIVRKEHLYELGQAWSQLKLQTDSLIAELGRYKEKCDDYSRSKVIRPPAQQLTEFTEMLRACENRHEDMRLLNNRHRYLVRQNMMDKSGTIKKAVAKCTDMWDSVYHSLNILVKEMRSSHELWTNFIKDRDVLLAKISSLSLMLKTGRASRLEVEEKLSEYQDEVDVLFGTPVSQLRSICTTDEHRKLDHMIQELTANLDTLRIELRPSDDLQAVEDTLDQFVQQTDHIEQDLESLTSLDVSITPTVDVANTLHAAETSSKVADIERRVDEMAQRAKLRRRLTPAITSHGSDESLDSLIDRSAADLQRRSRIFSRAGDDVASGEIGKQSASVTSVLIGRAGNRNNAKLAMIGSSLRSSSASCSALQKSGVSGSRPTFRGHRLTQTDKGSAVKSFSRPAATTSEPFQRYLNARRRSLSGDRGRAPVVGLNSKTKRARSVSLDRDTNTVDRTATRGRTRSAHPQLSTDILTVDTLLSPSPTSPPLTVLSTDSASTDFLLSVPPMTSLNKPLSDSEQRKASEDKQLRQDIKHTLEWIDKIEVLSTSVWGTSAVPSNLSQLVQCCRQYNELISQHHYFKNLVMSVNLAASSNPSMVTERDKLNGRWKLASHYLPSRQLQLESAVISSTEMQKEVEGFCDEVTHAELKILSGTHTKLNVAGEVRQTMMRVRSYITLLTSLLCESDSSGKQLLDTLRTCEDKCLTLIS